MLNPLHAIQWLLGYRDVPMMSRPTFRREIVSVFFGAIGMGAVVPQLTTIFAIKTLTVTWAVPFLVAEIAAGNFLATFFSSYLQRLPRVKTIMSARIGGGIALACVGLLAADPQSVYAYLGLLLVAALLGAAVMTVQASIRHSNYPASARGSILSRMIIVRTATMALGIQLASFALDKWPSTAHHWLYPIAGVALAITGLCYRGLRIRGERSLLRKSTSQPIHLLAGLKVLVDDRPFRYFMLWQMISGGTNLMLMPVLSVFLAQAMGASYKIALLASITIPFGVQVLVLPWVGKLFDRMQITHFRGIGCGLWAIGRTTMYFAAMAKSWPLIFVAYTFQGLGFAFGQVAWNVGHTRFAHPEKSQVYMGLHLSLQGFRGLILPFIGTILYYQQGIGIHLLGFCAAAQVVATVGFFFSPKPPPEAELIASANPDPSRNTGRFL